MTAHRLTDLTWTDLGELDLDEAVAILPIGAVEAHGPHLPLSTDNIIAEAMAEAGAMLLGHEGLTTLVLPTYCGTAAPFAENFPGTLSIRPETVTEVLAEMARSLERHGIGWLALANAHLDPSHIASLYGFVEDAEDLDLGVVFPDVTKKPWAKRLTEEFQSGACHAGCYETSIVMARRPELVREKVRRGLAANPKSLVTAIREGKETFEEAGGDQAYFGDPAGASVEEGVETVGALGGILAEAVLEAMGRG